MPVEGNRQPRGLLHGGAHVVLGESLGSMAANLTPARAARRGHRDQRVAHRARPLAAGVTGVCTPIHLGRTLTTHEIVMTDEQGRRCSTVRITNLIKDIATR